MHEPPKPPRARLTSGAQDPLRIFENDAPRVKLMALFFCRAHVILPAVGGVVSAITLLIYACIKAGIF